MLRAKKRCKDEPSGLLGSYKAAKARESAARKSATHANEDLNNPDATPFEYNGGVFDGDEDDTVLDVARKMKKNGQGNGTKVCPDHLVVHFAS